MATTEPKRRTITLTDNAPIRIQEDAWPVIARANGDSYGSHDPGRHQQALAQGECDTYSLRVRQHADGRAIVYGVLDAATAWTTHSEDWAGGALIEAGADLAAAIRRVAAQHLPERIIRECIADLPAEDLT